MPCGPPARAIRTKVVDGVHHVVGEARALADLAVMREVDVARPELHEPHDGGLELRRIELRGRGGGHDPRTLRRIEFAIGNAEGIARENAGGGVVDDGLVSASACPGVCTISNTRLRTSESLAVLGDGNAFAIDGAGFRRRASRRVRRRTPRECPR